MKKYALLIFAAVAFISCEDIQDNSPGLQTEINDVFFRANDARAKKNDDNSYVIQGYTQDEILTLFIESPVNGVYKLEEILGILLPLKMRKEISMYPTPMVTDRLKSQNGIHQPKQLMEILTLQQSPPV